jgi:hypothetical protein
MIVYLGTLAIKIRVVRVMSGERGEKGGEDRG